MAMITCPHCGESVSDKATRCVHCGQTLEVENGRYCPECGADLTDDMTECPKCGCPISNTSTETGDEKPQKVEVTSVNVPKKTKKLVGTVVVLLLAVGAVVFGMTQYQKKKEAEEYAQALEEYADNLKEATITMLEGASDAESSGNLIKKVWYNAIYEKRDIETDPYTYSNGSFVSDFNTALRKLFSDSDFKTAISNIEMNQATVNGLMKDLKNPPDEYKEAYDSLSELYNAYIALTNYVTDPSGSLQTYSSNFNDADTNTLNCYNAMKRYLED